MHANGGSPPSLPVEVWLQIFRWATLDSRTHALFATAYHPLQVISLTGNRPEVRYYTKYALTLVCKQWRRWTIPLLYEDIVVPQSSSALYRMLRHGADWDEDMVISPCASFVRRIYLPYSSTTTTSVARSPDSINTVSLCSSLQILVRHWDAFVAQGYEFEVGCPPLPSLKRLDWWHLNEAARTGGINSLSHVLQQAPNIEYLAVGADIWASYLNNPPVHLPHLTTLRLRRVNAYFVMNLCRWTLPALRHVVFDHAVNFEIFWPFWMAFGPQLRTIELGLNLKFTVQNFFPYIFAGCEQIEELNYHVLFSLPPPTDHTMVQLKTVGLHAHPSGLLHFGSEEYWAHLRSHFEALVQPTFPAIKQVLLHGDWSAVLQGEEFHTMTEPLRAKGCMIEVVPYTAGSISDA